jgi:hypothetical protein
VSRVGVVVIPVARSRVLRDGEHERVAGSVADEDTFSGFLRRAPATGKTPDDEVSLGLVGENDRGVAWRSAAAPGGGGVAPALS